MKNKSGHDALKGIAQTMDRHDSNVRIRPSVRSFDLHHGVIASLTKIVETMYYRIVTNPLLLLLIKSLSSQSRLAQRNPPFSERPAGYAFG
jgi:hypothetical protein